MSATNVEAWLARAQEKLRNDPHGQLPAGFRWAVIGSLGPVFRESSPRDHEGHRRRLMLLRASLRKVLHCWNPAWGSLANDALRTVDAYLEGSASEAEVASLLEAGRLRLEGLYGREGYAALLAEVALALLTNVRFDIARDAEGVDLAMTDDDLDIYDIDRHYLASVAYAGGYPGDPTSDPEKRREFWHWWLTEAVPRAYREGTLGEERGGGAEPPT